MWKRIPLALAVALALARCNGTNPTAPTPLVPRSAGSTSGAETLLVSGFPTWQIGGATGDFRVHPTEGVAPLEVHVNMCHSTDPSPGISLHYKVEWGDGSDDHGFCRFDHVYETPGQFQAVACVWDEIPAHAPGSCLPITFTANSKPTPPPLPPSFTPPTVGVTHTAGVINGSPWIVCRADASTAWLSADPRGTYNAITACQSVGYASVTAHGGTCGYVCNYCNTGTEFYDGGGGSTTSLAFTVMWRCAR